MVYNLYFHPLANFPGPWWAGISHLHEFSFDVILRGQFFKQIGKMHEQYANVPSPWGIVTTVSGNRKTDSRDSGPIVRINPREIHINDPAFYETIYASSTEVRNKDPKHVTLGDAPLSMVFTVSHTLHSMRRGFPANFFSNSSICHIEPMIQVKVDRLIARLKDNAEDGGVVNLHLACTALATDIISQWAYGASYGQP